jgi:hypothetical protein
MLTKLSNERARFWIVLSIILSAGLTIPLNLGLFAVDR